MLDGTMNDENHATELQQQSLNSKLLDSIEWTVHNLLEEKTARPKTVGNRHLYIKLRDTSFLISVIGVHNKAFETAYNQQLKDTFEKDKHKIWMGI